MNLKQTISVVELKHLLSADLNRRLGAAGTVNDLDIDWIDEGLGGATWGVSRISDDADPHSLRLAVAEVIPRLQALFDIEAPRGSPAALVRRPAPALPASAHMDRFLRERPFMTIGVAALAGLLLGSIFGLSGVGRGPRQEPAQPDPT
ncbi:MAG TPA: hypothetical protein VMU56_05135 [Beijerinckiaceae bacterium]|nr:hypothetical protein [Beijerinckiaceae bacterium]